MPNVFTNNDPVEKKINAFITRKMNEHPDIKSLKIQDIIDYIEY